jgi:hypothetical protein
MAIERLERGLIQITRREAKEDRARRRSPRYQAPRTAPGSVTITKGTGRRPQRPAPIVEASGDAVGYRAA